MYLEYSSWTWTWTWGILSEFSSPFSDWVNNTSGRDCVTVEWGGRDGSDEDAAKAGDMTREISRGMAGQPFAGSRLWYIAEKLRDLTVELGAGITDIMVVAAVAVVTADMFVSASVMMVLVAAVPVFRPFESRVSDSIISRVDATSIFTPPTSDGELETGSLAA